MVTKINELNFSNYFYSLIRDPKYHTYAELDSGRLRIESSGVGRVRRSEKIPDYDSIFLGFEVSKSTNAVRVETCVEPHTRGVDIPDLVAFLRKAYEIPPRVDRQGRLVEERGLLSGKEELGAWRKAEIFRRDGKVLPRHGTANLWSPEREKFFEKFGDGTRAHIDLNRRVIVFDLLDKRVSNRILREMIREAVFRPCLFYAHHAGNFTL